MQRGGEDYYVRVHSIDGNHDSELYWPHQNQEDQNCKGVSRCGHHRLFAPNYLDSNWSNRDQAVFEHHTIIHCYRGSNRGDMPCLAL